MPRIGAESSVAQNPEFLRRVSKDSRDASRPETICDEVRRMRPTSRSRHEEERFLRETEFLLRLMPDLNTVRRKTRGWDEFGEKIANQMEKERRSKAEPEESLWHRAKRVVHMAMTDSDAKNAAIRTRVGGSSIISPGMLADLSLWLAGELGVTISVTKRLVATMLVGVAESKGDWNVLAD